MNKISNNSCCCQKRPQCHFLLIGVVALFVLLLFICIDNLLGPSEVTVCYIPSEGVLNEKEIETFQNYTNNIIHYYESFTNILIFIITTVVAVMFGYIYNQSKKIIKDEVFSQIEDAHFKEVTLKPFVEKVTNDNWNKMNNYGDFYTNNEEVREQIEKLQLAYDSICNNYQELVEQFQSIEERVNKNGNGNS
ncbi:MAG: hypothetical protein Q4C70_03520 [Planctomycetia bacterium]|nr:hypothetical protein [Planctomycetia bacterium]